MSNINIRAASIDDASTILHFITELAIYEKAEEQVLATVCNHRKQYLCRKIQCTCADLRIGWSANWSGYLFLQLLYLAGKKRSLFGGSIRDRRTPWYRCGEENFTAFSVDSYRQ